MDSVKTISCIFSFFIQSLIARRKRKVLGPKYDCWWVLSVECHNSLISRTWHFVKTKIKNNLLSSRSNSKKIINRCWLYYIFVTKCQLINCLCMLKVRANENIDITRMHSFINRKLSNYSKNKKAVLLALLM